LHTGGVESDISTLERDEKKVSFRGYYIIC
jgi:hypothetical protein